MLLKYIFIYQINYIYIYIYMFLIISSNNYSEYTKKNYSDFLKVSLQSLYINSKNSITLYLVNFNKDFINKIKKKYENITIISEKIPEDNKEYFRHQMMCARYKMINSILENPNNKWCIYIDSDMIIRKNLSNLINNIKNSHKSTIFVQHQRKFSKIVNSDILNFKIMNGNRERDPNIIMNTGFIGLNNTNENKLFIKDVIKNIGISLNSDKLSTKADINKIWLPDQYSFLVSYAKFKNIISFSKLDITYNNHADVISVKMNKELLFNNKFHVWHCITLFNHPKFKKEFDYYLEEFNKHNI